MSEPYSEEVAARRADDADRTLDAVRARVAAAIEASPTRTATVVPLDLLRDILDATSERAVNAIRDGAFHEGIESFTSGLMSYEWHPQTVGTSHPYARRDWDGGYGIRM